jgi:hypothetical protein
VVAPRADVLEQVLSRQCWHLQTSVASRASLMRISCTAPPLPGKRATELVHPSVLELVLSGAPARVVAILLAAARAAVRECRLSLRTSASQAANARLGIGCMA